MSSLTPKERKEILQAAEEEAARMSAAPLLSAEDMADMSVEELDAYLQERGVQIDWKRIEAQVRSRLGTDVTLLNNGVVPEGARYAALEGKAQKAVVQAARTVANQTMGDLRQAAMDEADPRPQDEKYAVWVTVGGDGVCPDCQSRHGLVFALDAWEGNAPRDGLTVCDGNCRCSLVPCADPGAGHEGERLQG